MARNLQQVDDEGDDDAATYPVDAQRMAQFNANSRAAGAGGVQGGGPLSQGAAPQVQPAGGLGALAAGQFSGLSGPYQALYQQMQQKADAQRAAQQEYLASMQKQEGALSQTGMSDLDKASLMFQAAGALGQTTRSGGFGETLGNVATSVAGPLSKAAEAQRQRQSQLQQLQMARQKLGMEMAGTGGVDPAQALQLLKAQQEDIKASRGEVKPVTLKMADGTEVSAIFKNGQYYDPSGKVITDVTGSGAKEEEAGGVPADVRAKGPKAVEEYVKVYGKKAGEAVAGAESAAENIKSILPILQRAEESYSALAKNKDIGPYLGSDFNRRIAAFANTDAEAQRQAYEQASKELELAKAQITMKGQGSITEGERRILQLTLPRLDASRADTGMQTLKLIRQQMESAIAKPGRLTGQGAAISATEPQSGKPQGNVVQWGSLK